MSDVQVRASQPAGTAEQTRRLARPARTANRAAERAVELEYQTNALFLIGAAVDRLTELYANLRGLSTNHVISIRRLTLDVNGIGVVDAHVPAAALTVANYGTISVTATVGGSTGAPPTDGIGTFDVGPGRFVTFPLAGTSWAFYGRPGERVVVTVWATPQPPAGGTIDVDLNHAVPLPGATGIAYTAPWSNNTPTYAGFSVRETAGVQTTFRFRDGLTVAGSVLETVSLAPFESRSDPASTLCTTSSIFYELVAGGGTVEGAVRVT